MSKYWKKLILIFLCIAFLSVFIGPRLFYRPIESSAERVFLFEHDLIEEDDVDYEALGAEALVTLIETSNGDIIEFSFFDTEILKEVVEDLGTFHDVVKTINPKEPWDIKLIENSENLEIVIHARFYRNLFYRRDKVIVSKNFNIILPYIGGLQFSQYAILDISYLYGYLSVLSESEYVSYDHPVSIHTSPFIDDLDVQSEFYKANDDDIYIYLKSAEYDEAVAVIKKYIIPSS